VPRYITIPIEFSPEELTQDAYDLIRSHFPQWIPANGNLDTWIIQATASEAADLMRLASQVPQAIFRYFGSSLMNVQPIPSSPATGDTTWFAVDNAGYTIPAGTIVAIKSAGDDFVPFAVQADVTIPPGSLSTAVGAVPIEAVQDGELGSGLGTAGGLVDLIDPLTWVDHITQVGITTGGVDEELDDDYLDRLRAELQLMSPRPILPRDFSALARQHAAVLRATTVDGYNPVNNTYGNERMVAVALQDLTGAAASAQTKSEVQAMLDAMREVNFVVNVIDPLFRTIQITYTIMPMPGQDTATVVNNVNDALRSYLDPKNWGIPPDDRDQHVWVNDVNIRYLEVATLINNVRGVDYTGALFIGPEGGSLAAADYAMSGGPVILPVPGTISGVHV
jgi:hypothetical protein